MKRGVIPRFILKYTASSNESAAPGRRAWTADLSRTREEGDNQRGVLTEGVAGDDDFVRVIESHRFIHSGQGVSGRPTQD